MGQGLLKFCSIQLDRDVPCAQHSGGVGCIHQFVGVERSTIADRISRPWATLFVHERQQQARVEPAT